MNLGLRRRHDVPAKERRAYPVFSGLVLGAVLLPAMLYGVVAWQDRIAVLNQAGQNVQNTVRIYEEHSRSVFETHKLVASLMISRVHGMSWQEIADSRAVHEYLAGIVHDYPQIQSLWLADPSGTIRNSSAVFPVPLVSVADRDYFIALRENDAGLYVGQLVHGRVLTDDIFNVALRRPGASGSFDGVAVVSALPSYFTNFWNDASSRPGVVDAMVRRDGTVLARRPNADAGTRSLPATSPLMQATDRSDSGFYNAVSTVDGAERLYAFQKIAGFQVYVGHGISISGVLQTWHKHLRNYGWFFAIGTFALALLAVVAARRAAREAEALRRWRETAQQLREEAERRAVVEGQLRHAQKMEALGELTGGIAHDFGNILQVMIGSLDMLMSNAAPGDKRLVAAAREAAERGAKAIRSMMSFAKKQHLRSEVFDVNAVLGGMGGLLRQALGSRFMLDMAPGAASCWTLADRNQMELAILNLAINARDAMPDGGTVTVTTSVVRLAGEPDGLVGDFVGITVRDTGTGMLPDLQARVFDPFFTTKEPDKGTGLGLSMVYGFSKQSRGAVTIESRVGRGTSVCLYLPLSDTGRIGATLAPAEDAVAK